MSSGLPPKADLPLGSVETRSAACYPPRHAADGGERGEVFDPQRRKSRRQFHRGRIALGVGDLCPMLSEEQRTGENLTAATCFT